MHSFSLIARCLLCTIVLAVGCKPGASNDTFEGASVETRRVWQKAVELDKANDYMEAAESYDSLFHMKLTPKQEKTVRYAISTMYGRVVKAAADGDVNAQRIVETIKANREKEHSLTP